jgi:hypothetical protein
MSEAARKWISGITVDYGLFFHFVLAGVCQPEQNAKQHECHQGMNKIRI